MWRHTPIARFRGGICISNDGGNSWTPLHNGMPEGAVTHLVLDERSSPAKRVLYATVFGRGVYKSSDGGAHWAVKNTGLDHQEPFAWRLSVLPSGTLYLVIARRSENGTVDPSTDGELFRSDDGAEHWTKMHLPEDANGPNGLAVDPTDANRLYLATWARATGDHGVGGGIYLSQDAGHSWQHVLASDEHIYDVTVDPHNRGQLFAAGFESSAWRSLDSGQHWSRIGGYNFKWGHRVILDPEDPHAIYITTFGGSVWHGQPNAPVQAIDVTTPVLQPGRF
jgi:photosystem II stability/assembly factor-like uncharacterized protein